LVQKIKSILASAEDYPYLSIRCQERLREMRYITSNTGILVNLVTALADNKYAVFPWVGTRQLFTLHYALSHRGIKNKLGWITCVFLTVKFDGTAQELEKVIIEILQSDLDLYDLPLPEKVQVKGKYNEFIPFDLLRKQFVEDYLDFAGLVADCAAAQV
ncbi:MAG: hypothetical protein FWG43_06025, partial [Clostridiales bacterium]|nr:hypothetical protein [Clostridiales bacterium]